MSLGQCLQPDHTLTPVPVQGGDRPPCLQAPDVHQPTQGPVQTSAGQGREEVSEEVAVPSPLPRASLVDQGSSCLSL